MSYKKLAGSKEPGKKGSKRAKTVLKKDSVKKKAKKKKKKTSSKSKK